MELVKKTLKFDDSYVVEAKGHAGGLCLMWKSGVDVKVKVIPQEKRDFRSD